MLVPERADPMMKTGRVILPDSIDRITSYNVCYTKLLRNNVVIEDGLAFINTEDGAVIISDKGEIINNIPYRVAGYSEGYVRICRNNFV